MIRPTLSEEGTVHSPNFQRNHGLKEDTLLPRFHHLVKARRIRPDLVPLGRAESQLGRDWFWHPRYPCYYPCHPVTALFVVQDMVSGSFVRRFIQRRLPPWHGEHK